MKKSNQQIARTFQDNTIDGFTSIELRFYNNNGPK